MQHVLKIHERDNVVVAMRPLKQGERIGDLAVLQDIPAGHKIACAAIRQGEDAVKYGHSIGRATRDIRPGEHVHVHNIASALDGSVGGRFQQSMSLIVPGDGVGRMPTFDGFRRADGRVGIRNEIWIVNTVNCVNHTAQRIAEMAQRQVAGPGRGVEGVYAFAHPYGCAQPGDLGNLRKVLAGLVRHPNAAGVLVLGLGCESNQMKPFLEQIDDVDGQRIRFFNAQEVEDELAEGMRAIEELAEYAGQFRREPIPGCELVLGMKCGGSDGLSGCTANPLVGRVADRMTELGGTSLLSEVPEMFGAEQMLLAAAKDQAVFEATLRMVNEFREYFRRHGEPIDENPAPGNKEGGLTTLAEKSLGCVQKGGRGMVQEVLDYGQPATPRAGGIGLVNAPGNDGVSTTALTIAGAHMLLFTTGRGTPLGVPVPTIKIATNSDLARRKPNWIDFDAGVIADGSASIDELAEQLFELVLDVASGRKLAKNETNGYREINVWKSGVTA